jgi:hypothetical protein
VKVVQRLRREGVVEKVTIEVIPDPMETKPVHRKRLALVRAREVDQLAGQLRRQGVRDPIKQARDRLAERWGFASGQALHKWLRRNRGGH